MEVVNLCSDTCICTTFYILCKEWSILVPVFIHVFMFSVDRITLKWTIFVHIFVHVLLFIYSVKSGQS